MAVVRIEHLPGSRSDRIVWLMEELGLPYKIAPVEPNAVQPLVTAVTIDGRRLIESAFIAEFVIATLGGGRLAPQPDSSDYARYCFYTHFADATASPRALPALFMSEADPRQLFIEDTASPEGSTLERLNRVLAYLDQELRGRSYIAGESFSAADILLYFPLRAAHQACSNIAAVPDDVASKSSLAKLRNGLSIYSGLFDYYNRLTQRRLKFKGRL